MYVYRTRKPSARFRIPFLSYHFGYVGETTSFYHREQQHLYGLSNHGPCVPAPWSDLEPRCVLRIPLPPWKWLLRSVETIVILAVWPVYNDKKNRWNPRRISRRMAYRERIRRNQGHLALPLWPAVIVAWAVIIPAAYWLVNR